MFTTLLMKEIRETIITGKFLIATVLCLILIPLGMYVTTQEYRQRISDYRHAVQLYQQRSEGKVGSMFKAEGYRPPSPLSVFAVGLEPVLPNKAVTSESRDVFQESTAGVVKISNESVTQPVGGAFRENGLSLQCGIRAVHIRAPVYRLWHHRRARNGTLKLIASNPVPKWSILLAKITGNYLVFLLPFVVSFLTGLLILNLSGFFSMNASGVSQAILVISGCPSCFFSACSRSEGFVRFLQSFHDRDRLDAGHLVVFCAGHPETQSDGRPGDQAVESPQILASKIQDTREDLRKERLHRKTSYSSP